MTQERELNPDMKAFKLETIINTSANLMVLHL